MSAPLREDREGDESAFQREVHHHLRRNYAALVIHGLLGQTGFRLIQAPTFIPAYIHLLTGSDLAVGLVRACQSLGMFLSPILGATLIEYRRKVLGAGFAIGAAMRVQVLGIALAGFFLPSSWNLAAICLFLGLFGFFLGMQGVFFNFLVAKVIPVRRRGILMGLRNALSGVIAAGVGVIGGRLVDGDALGNGYAATFLVSFVLTALGLLMLPLITEPASPSVRERSRLIARLRDLPPLLRRDRAFTRAFLARALGAMGRMSMPFYWLYAATRIDLSGQDLGLLTGAFVIGNSLVNLVWGWLADRRGFRLVFLASLALWILSAVLLMGADGIGVLVAVFAGLGAGVGGFQMSGQNLVLEFGSRENLPLRIAVANTGTELVGAVGPLAGGALAMGFGYPPVFWTAVGFQCGALLLMLRVQDPRRR